MILPRAALFRMGGADRVGERCLCAAHPIRNLHERQRPARRPRQETLAGGVFIAVSSFSLVSAEFLPVGLLNAMAADLGISVGTAGLLVAASGLLAAISAPALTILAGQRDRRQVLLALSLLLTLSNLLSMTATACRPCWPRACCSASRWAALGLGASTANRLAPAGSEARATSVVYAGISVGIVLGVPLGTLIGQELGWRNAFAAASVVSALAYAVHVSLPTVTQATSAPASCSAWRRGRRSCRRCSSPCWPRARSSRPTPTSNPICPT